MSKIHLINSHLYIQPSNSEVLLLCFSSHQAGDIDKDKFQWYKTATSLNINVLFFREYTCDKHYSFYTALFKEVDDILNAVPLQLRRRVYTMGCSSGGFAALAFGCRYKAERVFAVSPQMDHTEEWHASLLPHERPDACRVLWRGHWSYDFADEFNKVTREDIERNVSDTVLIIHARDNAYDCAQVSRLKGCPTVEFESLDTSDHVLQGYDSLLKIRCREFLY